MQPAIRVEGLSKQYRLGARQAGGYRTLREAIAKSTRAPLNRLRSLVGRSSANEYSPDDLLALNDVSFEVQAGEVVGIIGRNGAGKSTLLKILSRIVEPTAGRAELRGRIGSLLEVGTGFHPELTGRENIFLNGAILGMSRHDIARKFDEIVSFADVERFLETPVKRYSTGMHVRLAFAVAAHLEPAILIVDEVLAVGDAAFQRKCLGRLREISDGCGKTVLLVSHNMAAIEHLCHRAILLDFGKVAMDGPIADVLKTYNSSIHDRIHRKDFSLITIESHRRPTPFLSEAVIYDEVGQPTNLVPLGGEFHLQIAISSRNTLSDAVVGIGFHNTSGQRVLSVNSPTLAVPASHALKRQNVNCKIRFFPLAPGEYTLKIAIQQNGVELDSVETAVCFFVSPRDKSGKGLGFHRGMCVAPSDWGLSATPEANSGPTPF